MSDTANSLKRFQSFAKRLFAVPKKEVEAEETKWREERAAAKRTKPKKSAHGG